MRRWHGALRELSGRWRDWRPMRPHTSPQAFGSSAGASMLGHDNEVPLGLRGDHEAWLFHLPRRRGLLRLLVRGEALFGHQLQAHLSATSIFAFFAKVLEFS